MKNVFLLLLSCFTIALSAQNAKHQSLKVKRSAIVDLSKADFNSDFFPALQKLEAPSPDGESYRSYLASVKEKMKAEPLYDIPEKNIASLGEQPEPNIIQGFETNTLSTGRPNDNDFAISDEGWMISVVNSHIHFEDVNNTEEDPTLISLQYFAESLGTYSFAYDPKVEYDPETGAFVLAFLNGYTANNTNIVLGFSLSGNPNGLWFLYELEGNPFSASDIWSDYPMISFSEDELFLTINLIKEGVSWQEGFTQTLIWQIDKNDGFSGQELDTRLWYDINFEGDPIRNLIPVEGGFSSKGPDQFFLSNRNFAENNDTIFVLNISGVQDDENTELSIKYALTDLPYTMPPNGRQPNNRELQTNDARILGACIEIGNIHFVCNSKNPETGFVEVYHGIIDDPYQEQPEVKGTFISNGIHDFGYPNLCFTGQEPMDEQYIIAFSYCSPDDFPGVAAIFYQDGEYSDILFIKDGIGTIYYSGGNNQYRWGDYSGIQYKYDTPGTVWLSNTFGGIGGQGETWVAQLTSPDQSGELIETSTEALTTPQARIAPNPVGDLFEVSFEAPAGDVYSMELYNANGQLVKILLKAKVTKGANQFIFSTHPLSSGMYILKVLNEEQPEYSFEKKVIVR